MVHSETMEIPLHTEALLNLREIYRQELKMVMQQQTALLDKEHGVRTILNQIEIGLHQRGVK